MIGPSHLHDEPYCPHRSPQAVWSKVPVRNGWYWWRLMPSLPPQVVRLHRSTVSQVLYVLVDAHVKFVYELGGEYCGPLEPPIG
jgi:hypothetical protein